MITYVRYDLYLLPDATKILVDYLTSSGLKRLLSGNQKVLAVILEGSQGAVLFITSVSVSESEVLTCVERKGSLAARRLTCNSFW